MRLRQRRPHRLQTTAAGAHAGPQNPGWVPPSARAAQAIVRSRSCADAQRRSHKAEPRVSWCDRMCRGKGYNFSTAGRHLQLSSQLPLPLYLPRRWGNAGFFACEGDSLCRNFRAVKSPAQWPPSESSGLSLLELQPAASSP